MPMACVRLAPRLPPTVRPRWVPCSSTACDGFGLALRPPQLALWLPRGAAFPLEGARPMKISVAICHGQLGPKIMRAFGRAFRHLGHDVIEYDALSDTAPPFGRPDLNVCYQLATKWIPPDAQSVQVWATDPAGDPRAMESVIQRQKEMDLAFFANKEWLDKAIYDEGLYAGHYLQLGIDTLVEPSGVACRKHKLGIFGGPYPGRVGELSVLVHEGIDMAIWGPAWENVPQLKRFHQGVIADEAEMLAAMNSCEGVGILPRGSEMPWSYWQALASSAQVMVGFEAILRGRHAPKPSLIK